MTEKKACTTCGNSKPISEFYKSKDCRKGVRPECKDCSRTRDGRKRKISRDKPVGGSKLCSVCNERKLLKDFFYRSQVNYSHHECKSCMYKRRTIKAREGRTPEVEKLNPATKKCSGCKKEKSLTLFQKAKATKDGLRKKCRHCRTKEAAAYRKRVDPTNEKTRCKVLQREMGITLSQYKKELASRKGICDMCGAKHERLVADHDHKTKKFRGFICDKENTGLGKLGDSVEGLQKAIKYLKDSKKRYIKIKEGK